MKLGTLLLRDAVISLGQLEEGLRAQVLYGGRLGTNLVELGFLDLNALGTSLARVHGVPLATHERFEATPAPALTRMAAEVAQELVVFPLGPELRSPDTLGVAFADPDKAAIDALVARIGGPIAPYVAPELRILYHIERSYGVKRSARFVRPNASAPSPVERRRIHATAPPTPVRLEPRRARVTAPPLDSLGAAPVSYLAAANAIAAASHRDQIAESLLLFCANRFAIAVLCILRSNNAIGWRAQERAGEPRAIDQLALSLAAASAFQVAHDTGRPYRGAPPSPGRPVERQLWQELGLGSEPDDLAVVPLVVKKRVVNLLYVHAAPGTPLDDGHVRELGDLALAAADAYLRLIQAAREARD